MTKGNFREFPGIESAYPIRRNFLFVGKARYKMV